MPKGQHLKPHSFKNGESGNPLGKRQFRNRQEFMQAFLSEMHGKDTRISKLIEAVYKRAISNRPDAIRAAELLLKYTWQLPKQIIEMPNPPVINQQNNIISNLNEQQLKVLSDLFDQQQEFSQDRVGEEESN